VPYYVYGADRPGVLPGLIEHSEAHQSYMDRYSGRLILRGPSLSDDGEEHTGSLHVVDVESRAEAEEFAHQEPYWLASFYHPLTIARAVVVVDRKTDAPQALVTGEWDPAAVAGLDEPDSRLSFLAQLVEDEGGRSIGIVAAVDAPPVEALELVQPVADLWCGGSVVLTARRWQRGGRSQSAS
jgi:uncharacterized protein YciI